MSGKKQHEKLASTFLYFGVDNSETGYSPYQLYLKFLYEYFKDELSRTDEVFVKYLPQEFKKLEYQEQAVLNAKKILMEYGGVFISDVVGLGKTYISAMLAGQLDGRTLVIAPPMLLEKSNPGSWPNVFSDFRVHADYESLGKLDDLLDRGTEKYTNIIIDEAHRFRTETTITYEKLAEICRGKRVILNKHRRHRLDNYFYPDDLRNLPISKIGSQKPFIALVNKILAITKGGTGIPACDEHTDKNVCATVREYERQIDQMVYELYGLAEDEIKIVEGATK